MQTVDINNFVKSYNITSFRSVSCNLVYFLLKGEQIVYIGRTGTRNSKQRFNLHSKMYYFSEITEIKVIGLRSAIDATIAEMYYINKLKPTLNTEHIGGDLTIKISDMRHKDYWQTYWQKKDLKMKDKQDGLFKSIKVRQKHRF